MKYIGMIIAGIIGFIIAEAISRAFRKDASTQGDDSGFTWIIKLIVASVLMAIIYQAC